MKLLPKFAAELRLEGEARFGHLDLLLLWHPAEDHAQPRILHLVPALSTLLVRMGCLGYGWAMFG